MKAVRIHAYGDRSVLQFEDAPKPNVKPDEALVRIVAAAVNPIDWKIREGHLKAFVPYVFPLTLGWDFSGVIEGLGSQVSSFAVGDAVFSRPDVRRDGSYAEYIAVRAVELARKPKTISHVEAASIPLAGITAWETIVSVGTLAPVSRRLFTRHPAASVLWRSRLRSGVARMSLRPLRAQTSNWFARWAPTR